MATSELVLDIQSLDESRLTVRAQTGHRGHCPEHTVDLPFRDWEIQAMLEKGSGKKKASSPPRATEAGERLFRAIFSGQLEEYWLHLQGERDATADGGPLPGMRLRLRFDLDDPHRGALSAMPWELLRDPRGGWLASERSTPIVRDVVRHLGPRRRSLKVESELRILVVAASPVGSKPISAEEEIGRLTEALGEGAPMTLMSLNEPTLDALRDVLLTETVHVLHFIGHGGYQEESGYGHLAFELPDGHAHQVDAEEFAAALTDVPGLRLVVLNSCEGARYGGRVGTPYYGVAARILERPGMPAVIAHQHQIGDETAVRLAGQLYRRLAAGDPVDVAVNETRFRLRSQGMSQWATPVLFMSAPDGVLFDVGQPHSAKPLVKTLGGTSVTTRSGRSPLHVGVRSFHGHEGVTYGTQMEAECDAFLDLQDHFDPKSRHGRLIRRQELWQEQVFPELEAFVGEVLEVLAKERRPLLIDLAAHVSIAFALGYLLEVKSSLDIRVRQRTEEHVLDWRPEEGPIPELENLWLDKPDKERTSEGGDLALAVSIPHPGVREDVEDYIVKAGLPVSRILDATVAPEPHPRAVLSGQHARRLAQSVVPWARIRRPDERGGKLHLFLSGPNAFTFYLGQLSRSLGRVVLYEFSFGMERRTYQRSIELPPPGDPEYQLPADW